MMENISNLYKSLFGGSVEASSVDHDPKESKVQQESGASHPIGREQEDKTEGTPLEGKKAAEDTSHEQVRDVEHALIDLFNKPEEKAASKALIEMMILGLPVDKVAKAKVFDLFHFSIREEDSECLSACFDTLKFHVEDLSELDKIKFDAAVTEGVKGLLDKFPESLLIKTLNKIVEKGFLDANSTAIKGALVSGISGVVFGLSFVAMYPAVVAGGGFLGATALTRLAVFMVSNPAWFMPFWTLGSMPVATSAAIISGVTTLGVNAVWEGARYGLRGIKAGANYTQGMIFGKQPEQVQDDLSQEGIEDGWLDTETNFRDPSDSEEGSK